MIIIIIIVVILNNNNIFLKGVSFILNRQRQKEGTCCAWELAGIEPTPPAPKDAGLLSDYHNNNDNNDNNNINDHNNDS